MARKLTSHLKLHVEEAVLERVGNKAESAPSDLGELIREFASATGWLPRPISSTPHAPVGMGHSRGGLPTDQPLLPLRKRVRLVSSAPMDGMLDAEWMDFCTSEEDAWKLLERIDEIVQQLAESERLVVRQEAQLAMALGVSLRSNEAELLAGRLLESLQRATELTGSDAAAIYLLDDATSALKMRSCWGLPVTALAKPGRQLRGSLADLEALMGNAVLVENTRLAPEWSCPEDFAAAMCLPIGSPTMPQGTLWLWSEHVRDFTTSDIEAARAATDKILVDIERGVLADEVLKTRSIDRQLESASLIQSSRLPTSQPLHHDYEIAGWTFQGQSLGGNFHTWTMNKHLQICAALGSSVATGAAGALVATSVQTVVETCWNSNHRPSQVLRKANDILWDVQDGDWRSALCYVQVHPASGATQLGMAGDIQAFVVGPRGYRMIRGTQTSLAEQPDTRFNNEQLHLEGGELLVIASASVLSGISRGGFSQEVFLDMVRNICDESVSDISDQVARALPMNTDLAGFARSLMIIRRRF